MGFYLICGLLLVFSAATVYALAPLYGRLALRVGLIDNPGERKIHATTVPYGGGIAILSGLFLTVVTAYLVIAFGFTYLPQTWQDLLAPHLIGLTQAPTLRKLWWIFGAALLIFTLGLIDDFRSLPPKLKLAVQLLAAAAVWHGGVRVNVIIAPSFAPVVNFLVTLGWIVIITNAFNLLDNMDGLAAGVALIASVALLIIMGERYYFSAALIAAFAGALAGFLPRNFRSPPHKLFLGDAGSLLIGFLLATMTIAGSYYEKGGVAHSLVMPVILLGVPLFDTCSVIAIRLRAGKSIMVGDNNHLSHRLTRRGFTRRQAVAIIFLLSLIFGIAAQLLRQIDESGVIMLFTALCCVIALMAILMVEKSSDT